MPRCGLSSDRTAIDGGAELGVLLVAHVYLDGLLTLLYSMLGALYTLYITRHLLRYQPLDYSIMILSSSLYRPDRLYNWR
jgi:hypothetical protein